MYKAREDSVRETTRNGARGREAVVAGSNGTTSRATVCIFPVLSKMARKRRDSAGVGKRRVEVVGLLKWDVLYIEMVDVEILVMERRLDAGISDRIL